MNAPAQDKSRRREISAQVQRVALVGIALNTLLALVKAGAGFLGHSYALIADGVESLSDVVTSIGVYIGASVAAAPPSEEHPYGKGRAETIAAAGVAIALFVASIILGIESVKEIRPPHEAPHPFTLGVLVVVVAIKEVLFRRVVKAGETIGSSALRSEAWHHRSDAITSACAFIGITVALLMGPGYEAADDWAALLASGVIAFNAWMLLSPALEELLDEQQAADLEGELRKLASGVPGVQGTHKCFIRKVGFDHFVDLDILVNGAISVKEGHDLAHAVQEAIKAALPQITRVLVHVEPVDEHGRTPLFH